MQRSDHHEFSTSESGRSGCCASENPDSVAAVLIDKLLHSVAKVVRLTGDFATVERVLIRKCSQLTTVVQGENARNLTVLDQIGGQIAVFAMIPE